MKNKCLAVLSAVLVFASTAPAAEWGVDASHSGVQFKVSHMVISTVTGNFESFDGTVWYDGTLSDNDSAHFTIAVTSIDTDNEKRDNHLRSDDFFNVEQYPEITFKSKKVIPGEGNKFKLVGDLTIRDVTKEVTFDCELKGQINDPWGNTRAGFSARSTINRQDFNVKWSNTLDGGGLVVSDDVELLVDLELIQKK